MAAEWQLELTMLFEPGRYSLVASVGEDVVLGMTPPEDDEAEAAVLLSLAP